MTAFTKDQIPPALQIAQQSLAQNRLRDAEILYRQVLAIEPDNPQATHGLGLVAMRVNRPDAAVELFIKSVAMKSDDPIAHLDLGNALLSLGRLEPAIASYRRSIELNPGFAGAYSNLGIALHEAGHIHESVECLQKAAELAPDLPEAHNNLGNVLKMTGQFTKAIEAYRRAISLRTDSADTQNNLASALFDSGRIEEAIAACRNVLKPNPASAAAHSNLVSFLAFVPGSTPQAIFNEHRRWNEIHAKPLARDIPRHGNDRSPDRRLRIGYVSPDLREHPLSCFLEGLLASHNPSQVETFCYADLQRRADATSQRIERLPHHWRNITGLSDQRVAEMVVQDQIDILVDLAGHTAGNRLLVFARKPAPVQVTYLGYPNTTGLDCIDYRLTDAISDPPGTNDAFYSEELVRLPDTFACYRPPQDAPDVVPLPVQSNGHLIFGSFNRLSKINADVISCWASILQRVDGSRLFMMTWGLEDAAIAQRLREAFGRHGIDADRLEFAGARSRLDYFAAHHRIDILLDPFPVNGHTITCHALWMGVPVITLAGTTHAGRLGASVLHNLQLDDLVAGNSAEYVQIAVRLAGNLPFLLDLRATLRDRMSKSPLTNDTQFASSVEQAYRTMWRRWCLADRLAS